MNFNGLLLAFDFHGGVEALAGLLGLPGDDGVIFFDMFVMNIADLVLFLKFVICEKMKN